MIGTYLYIRGAPWLVGHWRTGASWDGLMSRMGQSRPRKHPLIMSLGRPRGTGTWTGGRHRRQSRSSVPFFLFVSLTASCSYASHASVIVQISLVRQTKRTNLLSDSTHHRGLGFQPIPTSCFTESPYVRRRSTTTRILTRTCAATPLLETKARQGWLAAIEKQNMERCRDRWTGQSTRTWQATMIWQVTMLGAAAQGYPRHPPS